MAYCFERVSTEDMIKPTKEELELMQKLADCGEDFCKLPQVVNTDYLNVTHREFGMSINRLQDMVAARTVWRAMQNGEIKK